MVKVIGIEAKYTIYYDIPPDKRFKKYLKNENFEKSSQKNEIEFDMMNVLNGLERVNVKIILYFGWYILGTLFYDHYSMAKHFSFFYTRWINKVNF